MLEISPSIKIPKSRQSRWIRAGSELGHGDLDLENIPGGRDGMGRLGMFLEILFLLLLGSSGLREELPGFLGIPGIGNQPSQGLGLEWGSH